MKDTNGRIFGTGPDVITDVHLDGDTTVLTIGRIADGGILDTAATVRLTPDTVDLLVALVVDRSRSRKNRVDADMWGDLIFGHGRLSESRAAAWTAHEFAMRQQMPSCPDDVPGMNLWAATYGGGQAERDAYSRHIAEREERCAAVVRKVLAAAGPCTWFEITKHPDWRPADVHENDWGLAASLIHVLRVGSQQGWLVRTVVDNTVRFGLAEVAA